MILLKVSLLASFCALFSASSIDSPTLALPNGKLQGKLLQSSVLKRKFAAFYSIPYAKPPVGELRFKEPVPAEPWKGTLMANAPPPMCPQMDIFLSAQPKVVGSEDCLYLNVFTPKLPGENSKLMDVIFLIHGGGFVVSSGNHLLPNTLLDKDVVVVAINYRLGALGFLSTEDHVSPGNNGLKDQALALKWTRDNIAYFGGDPNKVTISGCSAGGASVHYHLLSKASRGLFNKAIQESGSALNPWALKRQPRKEAEGLATLLGCPTKCTEEMVKCLKQRPADHIILGQKLEIFSMELDFKFVPSIEPPSTGAFLDREPLEVMANGETADVPILASFARDEGLLFFMMSIADPVKLQEIDDNWDDRIVPLVIPGELSKSRKHLIGEELKQHYLGGKSVLDNKLGIVKMMGDWGFNRGIEDSSKLMSKSHKSPLYAYQFAYEGKINYTMMSLPEEVFKGKVNHCSQSIYTTPAWGCGVADDEPMKEVMVNLVMNFVKGEPLAKNWKPNKDGLPKFSLFNISTSEWGANKLEQFEDFSSGKFWKSLETKTVDPHHEL